MNERQAKKQLEQTQEWAMGVRRGKVAIQQVLYEKGHQYGIVFDAFDFDDFIALAHLPKYAPEIPRTIKTDGQRQRYGMGFGYGASQYILGLQQTTDMILQEVITE